MLSLAWSFRSAARGVSGARSLHTPCIRESPLNKESRCQTPTRRPREGSGMGYSPPFLLMIDGFLMDINWFSKKLVDVNEPSRN